jgi:predicted glycoside hydrolase/deacetylase ChbG (UPF0249 family)
MLARLLITADDAGQSEAIDAAIASLAHVSILTHVAVLATFDRLAFVRSLLSSSTEVGIHFNLSSGYSLLEAEDVPSIVDASGRFYAPAKYCERDDTSLVSTLTKYRKEVLRRFKADEVSAELLAQLREYERVFGRRPAFSTVHHDLDVEPSFDAVLAHVASDLPGRQRRLRSRALSGYFYAFLKPKTTLQVACDQIEVLVRRAVTCSRRAGGTPAEIVCHPGSDSSDLEEFTVYRAQREIEACAWQSKQIRKLFSTGVREQNSWIFEDGYA